MLKKQLFLVNIISLFIPILLVGVILLCINHSLLYGHHEEMLVSDNLRNRSIIFEVTTSITNICDSISEDPDVIDLLAKRYHSSDEVNDAYGEFTMLSDLYSRYTEVSSITLYTENKSLYSYEHIVVVDDTIQEWFDERTKEFGYFWETYSGENQLGVPYQELQLYHKINVPGVAEDALLVISISGIYLNNRIDNNNLDVDIVVNKDPVFYSTWGNQGRVIEFESYQEEEFFNFSGVDTYLEREGMLEISTIKPFKSEDSIYIFSSDFYANGRIKQIQMTAAFIIIFSLIVPSIIIIRFTLQLTNRVNTLRTQMHRVTSGDYDIIENFKGNDELVDLFKDLQVMIQSIEERDTEIYEGKIKEQQLISHQKEIELELLSSKINPHFLYNTLETIRMKAFNSDDLEVAQAVKLLGRYMRYNLESTGEMTTLASEIDYIHIYLSIQKLRFGDRIDFDILTDQTLDLEKIKIMPLLMQPLVENALIHGHEETLEEGRIWIRCLDEGDYVRIEIEDNGEGMDQEKLIYVRNRINSSARKKSSIGLYNVQERLKLFYGESNILEVVSSPGQGTIIGFRIEK